MKRAKGFTLIELMITVAILAIIVSVALPAYNNYVTRGKITEATTTLSGLRVTMEQYYQDNRTYLNGVNCGATMPTGRYFTYTCNNPAPTQNTYTIVASGVPAQGMSGFAYTVDQANSRQTVGAPAGWAAGTAPASIPPNPVQNCWVVNKNGAC